MRLRLLLPILLFLALAGPLALAETIWNGNLARLPLQGGSFWQVMGEMIHTRNEAAAVYMYPDDSFSRMVFYRFAPDATILAERHFTSSEVNYYGPSIAWDGQNYAIAASTLTRSLFLTVSPDGQIVLTPRELPDIPSGGRTAGFKVFWTGAAYAVFGLWLEPEYPGQNPSYGYYYTHLLYWLIQPDGAVLQSKPLGMLAPVSYPNAQGIEREYYDVVWTGQHFFIACFSESKAGPPLSTYIRMFDLAGNETRAEQPAFANTTAKGARLASSGNAIAIVGLKEVTLSGNFIYLRIFDNQGNPIAPEQRINLHELMGYPLGFGPTVSWIGDRFYTLYCDADFVGYNLFVGAFTAAGQRIGAEYALKNSVGSVVKGASIAMGVDLDLVGNGENLWLKNQHDASGGYLITVQPQVLALDGEYLSADRIADHLLGIHPLPPHRLGIADLNGDGVVDPADLVFRLNNP